MFDTRTKEKRDSYLDPRLAEFLSDEDRSRQHFLLASLIILTAIGSLFGILCILWSVMI